MPAALPWASYHCAASDAAALSASWTRPRIMRSASLRISAVPAPVWPPTHSVSSASSAPREPSTMDSTALL